MLKVKWIGRIRRYNKNSYGLVDSTGKILCEVCQKEVKGNLYGRYGIINGHVKLVCGHRNCLIKKRR